MSSTKAPRVKSNRSRKIGIVSSSITTLALLVGFAAPASADNGVSDFTLGNSGTGLNALSFSGANGWDLVSSGYSLSNMDMTTGAIGGDSFGQNLGVDYSSQIDMMSNDIMAIDAANLAERSRHEAEQKRAAEEEEKKKKAAGGQGAQGSVDATACPTSSPGNTLRSGSSSIGIAEICARSVAQARSPEAAQAIIYALNHLGAPYSQPKRNLENWYDCSSFVSRAYQSAGVNIAPPGVNAPSTRSMRPARWAVQIPYSETKPGDLVQPTSGHVVMKLADGWIAHTARPGDVSHVTRDYTKNAYWAAYVDPARV